MSIFYKKKQNFPKNVASFVYLCLVALKNVNKINWYTAFFFAVFGQFFSDFKFKMASSQQKVKNLRFKNQEDKSLLDKFKPMDSGQGDRNILSELLPNLNVVVVPEKDTKKHRKKSGTTPKRVPIQRQDAMVPTTKKPALGISGAKAGAKVTKQGHQKSPSKVPNGPQKSPQKSPKVPGGHQEKEVTGDHKKSPLQKGIHYVHPETGDLAKLPSKDTLTDLTQSDYVRIGIKDLILDEPVNPDFPNGRYGLRPQRPKNDDNDIVAPPRIQDLTLATLGGFGQSPIMNKVRNVGTQSPLTGGNLDTTKAKEVGEVANNGESLSPPSSSSTMSGSTLQTRLKEVTDSIVPRNEEDFSPTAAPGLEESDAVLLGTGKDMGDFENILSGQPPSVNIVTLQQQQQLKRAKKRANISGVQQDVIQEEDEAAMTPNCEAVRNKLDVGLAALSNGLSKMKLNGFAGPQKRIKSLDPLFAPVGITKGDSYVFATSQVTNQVAVFEGQTHKGVLKMHDKKVFNGPRNVLYVNGRNEENHVVVLDSLGFHLFNENGLFVRTILTGQGAKFRGLAYHSCHNNSEGFLISVDISGNDGASVCLISLNKSTRDDLQPFKRFLIEATKGTNDSATKCRFLAVNPCVDKKKKHHHEHLVYISAMESHTIYTVNLNNGDSSELDIHAEQPTVEGTFIDANQSRTYFEMGQPTGIVIDLHGNIIIADRHRNSIDIFAPNGLHLGRFIIGGYDKPVGIHLDAKTQSFYVASNGDKSLAVYELNKTLANED